MTPGRWPARKPISAHWAITIPSSMAPSSMWRTPKSSMKTCAKGLSAAITIIPYLKLPSGVWLAVFRASLFSGCSLYYRRLHPFFLSLYPHPPADYSHIPASEGETAPSEDESCPVNRQRSTSDGEAAAKKSDD